MTMAIHSEDSKPIDTTTIDAVLAEIDAFTTDLTFTDDGSSCVSRSDEDYRHIVMLCCWV